LLFFSAFSCSLCPLNLQTAKRKLPDLVFPIWRRFINYSLPIWGFMNEKNNSQRDLPSVICECGTEILVVTDLDEMARSIEAHAAIHEKSETDPEKAKSEYCRIEELLTQKVLILIGKNYNRY
jgi:hypothetical protein